LPQTASNSTGQSRENACVVRGLQGWAQVPDNDLTKDSYIERIVAGRASTRRIEYKSSDYARRHIYYYDINRLSPSCGAPRVSVSTRWKISLIFCRTRFAVPLKMEFRYGYWDAVVRRLVRNVDDEQMAGRWQYTSKLARRQRESD